MGIRAIFCDIDGTLLDSSHVLRPATAERIRVIHDAGTPFVLVSARSPSGVFLIQRRIGIAAPVVCYGGALVLDESGDAAQSIDMEMRETAALKDRIAASWPSVAATVYSHDDWFVDDMNDPRVAAEAAITGAVPTEIRAIPLVARNTKAHKMFCVGTPAEILDMEKTIAGENPRLAVIKSNPRFLEIMDGRATKANAMRHLCQAMRIPLSDVLAFGDNYNDVDMLECAGLGIAMENAPAEVKARADRTTADNDNEGVLQALDALAFSSLPPGV